MIYAVDIGSTISGAFAWAKVPRRGDVPAAGEDPEALVHSVTADLNAGQSVAIGLEAPLFIPVPHAVNLLSRRRKGESNRPWSAIVGGYVATLALHQVAWLLVRLRESCSAMCALTVDPAAWSKKEKHTLFFWEAFVSGSSHTKNDHKRDAATAATFFRQQQDKLTTVAIVETVTAANPLSLFGAAVLWSGWSDEKEWLSRPLLVLKPSKPWDGEIDLT